MFNPSLSRSCTLILSSHWWAEALFLLLYWCIICGCRAAYITLPAALKLTLSSKSKVTNCLCILCLFSQVQSLSSKPFHLTNTSYSFEIGWVLIPQISSGSAITTPSSVSWGGIDKAGPRSPMAFLSWDTWNVGWMRASGGNAKRYATFPTLAATAYGP